MHCCLLLWSSNLHYEMSMHLHFILLLLITPPTPLPPPPPPFPLLAFYRPSTATPDAESSVAPKHPLRIDLRHNNPERGTRIAEDLLECSLYSTRMSSLEGDLSYEKAQLFRKTPGTARVEYESRPSTAGSTGKV